MCARDVMTSRGLVSIATFKDLPSLKILDVSNNQLVDVSVVSDLLCLEQFLAAFNKVSVSVPTF